ncbi:MAG: alpha/beta fold hydrolase, partial [Brevinema sp.]
MKYLLLLIVGLLTFSCQLTPYNEKRDFYYVKSAGAELPVVISGVDTEDIILFVHGGPGSSGLLYYYAPAFEQLRTSYKMVFYDQRGSGGARGHISKDSITIDQHVKDLDAVVNSLKIMYPKSRISLLGHSYGGMIAGAYTSINQQKLANTIFLSPALNVVDLTTRIPTHFIEAFIDPYLKRTDITQENRKYWTKAKEFYQN